MNSRLVFIFSLGMAAAVLPLAAQTSPPDDTADAAAAAQLSEAQLDQLYGPIALYPDALVALVLPAATEPSDVVLAERYLAAGGDPAQIDSQPWDDSVKALAHYPDVIKWMDANLTWTKQAGEVFLGQPADVMKSIQRLRARAKAVGSLTDTPQQQVVMQGDDICIEPVQPDVIYVPYYDPGVVYIDRPYGYAGPFLTFGVGFPIGVWLDFGFDWGRHTIWVGRGGHDWHDRHFDSSNARRWRPAPTYVHRAYRAPARIVRPQLFSTVVPRSRELPREQMHPGEIRRENPGERPQPGRPVEFHAPPPEHRAEPVRPQPERHVAPPVRMERNDRPMPPAPAVQHERAPASGRENAPAPESNRREKPSRDDNGKDRDQDNR